MLGLPLSTCGEQAQFQNNQQAAAAKEDTTENATGDTSSVSVVPNPDGKPNDQAAAESTPIIREYPFKTEQIADHELSFIPSATALTTELTMRNDTTATTANFQQVVRPVITQTLKQGNPGQNYQESFLQNNKGVLDLVVVIDNSGSMSNEQTALQGKLPDLLTHISESEWQINIVTTDPRDGCSRTFIRKSDADAGTKFATGISPGINGDGNEQGIRMSRVGLGCSSLNDWPRKDSTLAVLIVSDEDNCSKGSAAASGNGNCATAADGYDKPDNLRNYIVNTLGREIGTEMRAYGLIWPAGVPQTQCTTAYNQGNEYSSFITSTMGKSGIICDGASYSDTLKAISSDVATILKNQFTLKGIPDLASLTVDVKLNANTRRAAPADYTINGNTLTFVQNIPAKGSQIFVAYTAGAKPLVAQYTLSESPALGSVQVKANNVVLTGTQYSISGKVVQFAANALPYDANVEIVYKKNDPLLKDFLLNQAVEKASLKVKINGVLAPSGYTFDQQSGLLKFDSAPIEGAAISAEFLRIAGKVLTYPIAITGDQVLGVKAYRKTSPDVPVSISYENGQITMQAADHEAGQKLKVEYMNEDSDTTMLVMEHEPLLNSLQVESSDPNCKVGQGVQYDNSALTINCNLILGEIAKISYQWEDIPKKSFSLPEEVDTTVGRFEVYINNVETTGYRRNRNLIFLNELPPAKSEVMIRHIIGDE
jgi:hypothetical protein